MADDHFWAFERGTLWAREFDGTGDDVGGDVPPIIPSLSARLNEARAAESGALAVAMGLPDVAEVSRRLESGRRCFLAWVDGSIASYGWVSRGIERIGELERSFRMSPDEVYIWDCATLPKYRGQHLYCALLSHIVATLHHEGVRRLWIGASLQNTPSIRAFATAGFRPVLTLTYLRLLGMRHVWVVGDASAPLELVTRARWCLSA